jgi:hypothetical protein
MDTTLPPTPGTTAAHPVEREARAVVAEANPFEDPPATEAERTDDELVARWGGVRLLHEIVRRIMWEEGEI